MSVHGLVVPGLVVLVGAVMVGAGAIKLLGSESQVEEFREFGYPQWFRLVVGTLECLGGVGLVAGRLLGDPLVFVAGGAVLAVVLLGAVGTHVRVGDPLPAVAPAALLFALTIALLMLRPVAA